MESIAHESGISELQLPKPVQSESKTVVILFSPFFSVALVGCRKYRLKTNRLCHDFYEAQF